MDHSGFNRTINHKPPAKQISQYVKIYEKWRGEINPFIPTPYSVVTDKVTITSDNRVIFDAVYNTEDLGLRVIPGNRKNLLKHLIVVGDSNTFGVGCADNETLPYYLSLKFPNATTYNFAQAGTGPHSTLRFLEIFKVSDFASQKEGAMVMDFHLFFLQRIIGSKSFLAFGESTPQYTLDNNDIPVYRGPFSESIQAKFYKGLDKIPYSHEFFPDLPRIGSRHIDLTSRVILAIKNKYLQQTSKTNKFFVFINPERKATANLTSMILEDTETVKAVAKKLKELGVDVITFEEKEVLDLPHFDVEGHMMPVAHKNYAQMIYDKLKDKI